VGHAGDEGRHSGDREHAEVREPWRGGLQRIRSYLHNAPALPHVPTTVIAIAHVRDAAHDSERRARDLSPWWQCHFRGKDLRRVGLVA
jgi:hypothetical protein